MDALVINTWKTDCIIAWTTSYKPTIFLSYLSLLSESYQTGCVLNQKDANGE